MGLVTFIEEILNGKLNFLYSDIGSLDFLHEDIYQVEVAFEANSFGLVSPGVASYTQTFPDLPVVGLGVWSD